MSNTSLNYVDIASSKLGLSNDIKTLIITPDRELHFELPIARDDGSLEIFMGYRVQHNNSRGPNKGGICFSESLNINQARELAALMTYKSALLDLPFGGAYGGVECNSKQLSEAELERLTRLFVSKVDCITGPQIDIPGPDLNTGPKIMSWMLDEYSKRHGFQPASVTGKPLELFGTLGREESTASSVVACFIEACKHDGVDYKDKKIIVHGFGHVGLNSARLLSEVGCQVIGVCDSKGGIYNPEGIDINKLIQYKIQTGSVVNFDGASHVSSEDILKESCDVLILASLFKQVNEQNCKDIKAKMIIEGANSPITFEANNELEQMEVKIIPDLLANSGGMVVSYFEWVQNVQQFKWDVKSINSELLKIVTNAFHRSIEKAEEFNLPLRTACYLLSLQRLAAATQLRGYQ